MPQALFAAVAQKFPHPVPHYGNADAVGLNVLLLSYLRILLGLLIIPNIPITAYLSLV